MIQDMIGEMMEERKVRLRPMSHPLRHKLDILEKRASRTLAASVNNHNAGIIHEKL
jgi:hypothetical protein